jgi:poly(3-hydroxybutyrate) depolymerase
MRVTRLAWLRLAATAAIAVGVALVPAVGATTSYDLAGGDGHVEYRNYGTVDGINFDYLVYLPVGWKKSERLPVYVMLHGCGTTAAQQMGANRLNPIADRERFIVVYPDNGGGCWRAVSDDGVVTATEQKNITRGAGGDADTVATMTKRAITEFRANADRVYLMGMSSGAFQTSSTAADYPELYAAAGVMAGSGPGMSVLCAGEHDAVVPLYAQWGVNSMGPRARVMPFFSMGGTEDPLGELGGVSGCARLAYREWLYIDNMLRPAAGATVPGASALVPPALNSSVPDTFKTDPSLAKTGTVPGGYTWTVDTATSPSGCRIAEEWVVQGMSHYWSGGSTDPQYAAFNDPKGPSASQLSWDFFKQFSLRDGNTTCH